MQQHNVQAAVMVVLSKMPQGDAVLLTKRASNMRLHSGEIAFPGGKVDNADASLLDAAFRETREEVALQRQDLNIVERLDVNVSRTCIDVHPFVARVDWQPELTLSEHEVESAFWVPISFFVEDKRLRTDEFQMDGKRLWAPAYQYEEHLIWGLTSRIIVDLMNKVYGTAIHR